MAIPPKPPSIAVVCKLQFVCHQLWDDLHPVPGQENIRHCGLCNEDVHWCDDHAEFVQHAKRGRCVALPQGGPGGGMWVGGAGCIDDLDPEPR